MSKLKILKLNDHNTLVIRQEDGNDLFISNKDGVIISITNLSFLLKFLVFSKFISVKVLEQIVNEWYSYTKGE